MKNQIDCGREARKIVAAINTMIERAKLAGIENPKVFLEPESGIFIMDGDHAGYVYSDTCGLEERQAAIVGRADLSGLKATLDAGAW